MRLKFAILFLGLSLLACSSGPDFHVDLSVTHSEVSEDSNSTTETVVIDGYEGTYHWVYSGYSPDENMDTDQEFDFTLTDEDLQSLTLLVRENGLMISREETVSSSNIWTSFEVSWNNSMGGQSASGHVVGTTPEVLNPEQTYEDESLYAAEQIVEFVKEKVGFSY